MEPRPLPAWLSLAQPPSSWADRATSHLSPGPLSLGGASCLTLESPVKITFAEQQPGTNPENPHSGEAPTPASVHPAQPLPHLMQWLLLLPVHGWAVASCTGGEPEERHERQSFHPEPQARLRTHCIVLCQSRTICWAGLGAPFPISPNASCPSKATEVQGPFRSGPGGERPAGPRGPTISKMQTG